MILLFQDIISPGSSGLPFNFSLNSSDTDARETHRNDIGSSPINKWAVSDNQSPPDFEPDDFCD